MWQSCGTSTRREHLLAPALTDGMNVGDWLRLLNSFAYLFTSPDRLQALRSAYRTTPPFF